MSIIDSEVRLRANDETYSLAGNRDLTDKKVIVYNDGNMGLETVDTDHVLALDAHVKLDGTEKAFRTYVAASLSYGYWQGGNFGYLHKWNITGDKPLLYQYPFSGAGTDLDFPVVGSICDSKVGGWWLGVGGWFEIVTPTWTDPSWDWVSSVYTLYTDKTKCSGNVYAYRIGATYYLRIWTLTDGVWGYITESGWDYIDGNLEAGNSLFLGIWEWDSDVYYAVYVGDSHFEYCKNGTSIGIGGAGFSGYGATKILVSDNYAYLESHASDAVVTFIFSKTGYEAVYKSEFWYTTIPTLISPDKCIVVGRNKYRYINGKSIGSLINLPASPIGRDGYFDGGEDGKALQNSDNSYDYQLAGFDPVAGTWTDYGRPWG